MPQEALVEAGHVGGTGQEPTGDAPALRDEEERAGGAADPPVEALEEAGPEQSEKALGDLAGVQPGGEGGIGLRRRAHGEGRTG